MRLYGRVTLAESAAQVARTYHCAARHAARHAARRHRPHYMTRPPATPYLTGLASADHNLGPGGDMRMRAAAAALHTLFNYDALNYYAKTRRERQREAGRGEGTKGGCAGLRA